MQIYKQTDPSWEALPLGNSPYKMGEPGVGYGCTTVAVAQLLALAGWDINPAQVCQSLEANGGYTDQSNKLGGGLLIWDKLMQAYPQFHWKGGGPYHLWSGRYGASVHWLSEKDGTFYDSITGRSFGSKEEAEATVGVKGLTLTYANSIDQAPVPVNVNFFGTVSVSLLNARQEATRDSATIKQVGRGTLVEFLEKKDDGEMVDGNSTWYKRAEEGLWMWSGGITLK